MYCLDSEKSTEACEKIVDRLNTLFGKELVIVR